MEKKKEKKKMAEDERFSIIQNDPRFDVLPTKKRKVVVDDRFKSMLSDEKFSSRSIVDMRGRKINFVNKNSLKDLYQLEKNHSSTSEDWDSEDEKEIKIDLARGDGNISSSDDDSDEEWDLDEDEIEEHCWGEFDRDARRVEWASRRLALCNMEWDFVNAADIYVLLSSFKPPAPSEILSVTIYLSDFGKERLEEEEKTGPKLRNLVKPIEEGFEMDNKTREALRAYQLDRMRYYYAIIECDNDKTASSIYESCDGVEFESSAVRMDLRFVPDEMTFDENMIKDKASESTININNFKPKNFESSAMSKSSSKLTWDETDPERLRASREAFDRDVNLEQFQNLIAPASSDEEEFGTEKKAKILLSVETAKVRNKDDIDVKWEPELQIAASSEDQKNKLKATTPWENFLKKKKAKRKERKARIAELRRKRKLEIEGELQLSTPSASKGKINTSLGEPNVEIRIDDERFAALYSNSAFAIDQSNPLFKPTSLIMKQVSQKQKLRQLESERDEPSLLIEKIKKKTKTMSKYKSFISGK